jgi:thiamine-monophosphate kinase
MELEFIRWLREHVPNHPNAPLGLSDDAAIVSLAAQACVVVTIDTLTDGVDFRLGIDDPRRIGRQALAANLSDLAAMAATPVAAVISLALPRNDPATNNSLKLAIALYEGLLPLAKEYDVAIAGGDTNTFDGPLVISVAAFGRPAFRGPLTRSGGRPGDWLLVTGSLGGSILGHMFDFRPRVREAIALHAKYELHAAIDISDGLALDASRLAAESGCGAVIFTDRIPIAPDAFMLSEQEQAARPHATALKHALSDGQDFELLIAATPEVASRILHDKPVECRITHVGELTAEPGLWQQTAVSERTPLEPIGWRHS